MTDLERFTELYKSFSIECVVFATDLSALSGNPADDRYCQAVRLIEPAHYPEDNDTTSELFGGYRGFYTQVFFDMDGKFLGQGFWE